MAKVATVASKAFGIVTSKAGIMVIALINIRSIGPIPPIGRVHNNLVALSAYSIIRASSAHSLVGKQSVEPIIANCAFVVSCLVFTWDTVSYMAFKHNIRDRANLRESL
jgi:hypothetical protein